MIKIDIIDYIKKGGIKNIFPYSEYKMEDFFRISKDENIWNSGSYTIFSFPLNKIATFQIAFENQTKIYHNDSIEINHWATENHFLYSQKEQFLSASFAIIEECADEDEKVIFLSNGVDIHFLKNEEKNDFLLSKINPNAEKYRKSKKKYLIVKKNKMVEVVKIPKKFRDICDLIRNGKTQEGIAQLEAYNKGLENQKKAVLAEVAYFEGRWEEALQYDIELLPYWGEWHYGNLKAEHLSAMSFVAKKLGKEQFLTDILQKRIQTLMQDAGYRNERTHTERRNSPL